MEVVYVLRSSNGKTLSIFFCVKGDAVHSGFYCEKFFVTPQVTFRLNSLRCRSKNIHFQEELSIILFCLNG